MCELAAGQCTVVSSSSKSGTLNPALNGLYLLMHYMDHYQILTRPGSWSDLGLVLIWLRKLAPIECRVECTVKKP